MSIHKILICCCVFSAALLISVFLTGCGPSSPDGCLRQAERCYLAGKLSKAEKLALKAEKLAPDRAGVHVMKALIYEKSKRHDLAIASAAKAAKLNPRSFVAQYTLGNLYAAGPRPHLKEAITAYQIAMATHPNDPNILIAFSNLATRIRWNVALNFLSRLSSIQEYKDSARLHNQIGMAHLRSNRREQARRSFETAVRCASDDERPVVTLNLARVYDYYFASHELASRYYKRFISLTDNLSGYDRQRLDAKARLTMFGSGYSR